MSQSPVIVGFILYLNQNNVSYCYNLSPSQYCFGPVLFWYTTRGRRINLALAKNWNVCEKPADESDSAHRFISSFNVLQNDS